MAYDVLHNEIARLHSAAEKVERLTSVGDHTLIYKTKSGLYWLNCNESPTKVTHSLRLSLEGKICCVQTCLGQTLVVGLDNDGTLSAVSATTGRSEWTAETVFSVFGGNRDVTTDGEGHIFVCSQQEGWVKAFSDTNGGYIKTIVREGENGFGRPCKVCWSKATDSLIVAHEKAKEHFITSVPVKWSF